MRPAITLTLALAIGVGSSPLEHHFSSCVAQHADSEGPPDQAINLSRLYVQLDANDPPELHLSFFGNVSSPSLGYSAKTNYLGVHSCYNIIYSN